MKSSRRYGFIAAVAALSAHFPLCIFAAEDKKPEGKDPKLEWSLRKGEPVEFTVSRSSATEGEGAQGAFKTAEDTETVYRLEAGERKEGGELELKVTYVSLKSKQSGRGQVWEFDSSKKEGDDENAAYLRDALKKTATVRLKDGKIAEVQGLPEQQRPEGNDRAGYRQFRIRSAVSRRSLEPDLQLILAAAVSGQSLEPGKEYRLPRPEQASADSSPAGRGRFLTEPAVAYRYQGREKAGEREAAKFSLSPDGSENAAAGAGGQRSVEGKALVSPADGLLLSLELKSERKSEGERNGQTFRFTRSSTTRIERAGGALAAKKTGVSL